MQDFRRSEVKVRNGIIFIAFFLVLLYGASALFIPKNDTVKAGIDERDESAYAVYAEPRNSMDAVIIGDSLAYTSISPLKMWHENGFTSYNCSRTAQRMSETYYMLKRVFEVQSPKVVVFETNMLFWPSDTEEQINKTLFEAAEYYLPVFEYHNQWKKIDPSDLQDAVYEKQDQYKGFRLKKDCIPYAGGEYMIETMATREVPRVERFLLGRMIQLCRKNGSQFMMVSVPSPKDYRYENHNSAQSLADKYGVEYLDLNLLTEEIGIDWNLDVLDGTEHLNVYGAEKVSDYLGAYISENYEVEGHRDDKTYSEWNQYYEDYQKEVQKNM